MGYETENTLEKREKRVADAIALREPDRVPFAPNIGRGFPQAGGINMRTATTDFTSMKDGIRNFLGRYEMDMFLNPAFYPIPVMEALGTSFIRWAGKDGLDENSIHQIVDKVYVEEEQYDEFLTDPSRYMLQKVWPKRHDKLAALSKISFDNVWELGHFTSLCAFADPEVQEAFKVLEEAGKKSIEWLQQGAELGQVALEMQCPLGPLGGMTTAYDMWADNLRGFVNLPIDVLMIPDKVEKVLDVMQTKCLEVCDGFGAMGFKYNFIPLHGGMDSFMSNENYEKFYWKYLREMIERNHELGMVSYVFVEGPYNSRLEMLAEVPKGSTIYLFEDVDLALAKKTVGDVACIAGMMDSADLAYGTKEQVIEKTKRIIDTCAPGGGFMMNCTIPLDVYDEGLMDAWYETTLKEGGY